MTTKKNDAAKTAKRTATTKRTTKKTAATQQPVVNPAGSTRVVCPECGAEFDILAQHEHQVKNATVIGMDSGLGTIYLPVSKRGEALKAAGVDTSNYFSIKLPTGGEQMMRMGDDGKAVPVTADDPIIQVIMRSGTVPNRNLFRRWVMSQVFHWLSTDEKHGSGEWLKRHGYKYQWEMLVEELRVQSKLFGRDMENFRARHRWFNQELAEAMAEDYIGQIRNDIKNRKQYKCKGVPYVKFNYQNVFLSDVEKKIVWPMRELLFKIENAKTPQALYLAASTFKRAMYSGCDDYKQSAKWKDAYKGMGAYATMQNLLRFHGCQFPKDNDFYDWRKNGEQMLEDAANTYMGGDGWRLFGLMKQMIASNGIDIEKKMQQWAAAKQAAK